MNQKNTTQFPKLLILLGVLQLALFGLEVYRINKALVTERLQMTIEEQQSEIASLKNELQELQKETDSTEKETSKKYLGEFELTFYSKEQFPNSKTSTGVWPTVGRTIAVDPSVIPYGTKVEIEGFGVRYAEDTGGAIKGNKIDIFVETTAEALQLGRQHNKDVWVIE